MRALRPSHLSALRIVGQNGENDGTRQNGGENLHLCNQPVRATCVNKRQHRQSRQHADPGDDADSNSAFCLEYSDDARHREPIKTLRTPESDH
jgi:hypothetical protein